MQDAFARRRAPAAAKRATVTIHRRVRGKNGRSKTIAEEVTTGHWREALGPVPDARRDYRAWLVYQKEKWRIQRTQRALRKEMVRFPCMLGVVCLVLDCHEICGIVTARCTQWHLLSLCPFTHPLTHPFTHSFTHFTHPFTHPFTHSFTHSHARTCRV